ncbi:hypothetical protein [Calidithermus roseus]|nr:hypothetical protein [Calidithermus roseus]
MAKDVTFDDGLKDNGTAKGLADGFSSAPFGCFINFHRINFVHELAE